MSFAKSFEKFRPVFSCPVNVYCPACTDEDSLPGSMSESGAAESEEEEELDDQALGIKGNARSPRSSPRRKPSQQASNSKGKGGGKDSSASRHGAPAKGARSLEVSLAQGGSSSESSGIESSAASSSSESGCERRGRAVRGKVRSSSSADTTRHKAKMVSAPKQEGDEESGRERVQTSRQLRGSGPGSKGAHLLEDGHGDERRRLQKVDEVGQLVTCRMCGLMLVMREAAVIRMFLCALLSRCCVGVMVKLFYAFLTRLFYPGGGHRRFFYFNMSMPREQAFL